MTERSNRLNRLLFVGFLGLLGVGGVYLGLLGFLDVSVALKRHNNTLASFPYSSTILLISVFLLVTAALSCLPTPGTTRSIKARAQTPKWVERLRIAWLVYGVVSVIGAFFIRPIQFMVIDQIAHKHGYVACPTITLRHDDDRWALPGPNGPTARCPTPSGQPVFSAP